MFTISWNETQNIAERSFQVPSAAGELVDVCVTLLLTEQGLSIFHVITHGTIIKAALEFGYCTNTTY